MISESIEIDRTPEDVFAYLDQLDRHHEWQQSIVATRIETEGPTRVGTRAVDTRSAAGRKITVPYEVTEHAPPSRLAFLGTSGTVRPAGRLIVESLDGGARARVTIELDMKGHGLGGGLLASIAKREVGGAVPTDQARLKEILERDR